MAVADPSLVPAWAEPIGRARYAGVHRDGWEPAADASGVLAYLAQQRSGGTDDKGRATPLLSSFALPTAGSSTRQSIRRICAQGHHRRQACRENHGIGCITCTCPVDCPRVLASLTLRRTWRERSQLAPTHQSGQCRKLDAQRRSRRRSLAMSSLGCWLRCMRSVRRRRPLSLSTDTRRVRCRSR
jgi:hypothetical protein